MNRFLSSLAQVSSSERERLKSFPIQGKEKSNQNVHAEVVNVDVGNKDLQQCADAIIRLRAEYLFSIRNYESIHFNFTSGDRSEYLKWKEGYRPVVHENKVFWKKSKSKDNSYQNFKNYLQNLFIYAGSFSLEKEMKPVTDLEKMEIGDVFINGGFPGHAVIVADMAFNPETDEKLFLLAQSYMPAQDIHILKNPNAPELSPWYQLDFGEILDTPDGFLRKMS